MGEATIKGKGEQVKIITDNVDSDKYFTLTGRRIVFKQECVDRVISLCGVSFRECYWGVYFEYNGETKVGCYLNRAHDNYYFTANSDVNGFDIDIENVSKLDRFILIVRE